MDGCPTCAEPTRNARVVCTGCGEVLPLQIAVVSEGSHGGGFALAKEVSLGENADPQDGPAVPDGQRGTVSEDKETSL